MKNVAELRRKHNLPIILWRKILFTSQLKGNQKSPIHWLFQKSLQPALPFASKPKDVPSRRKPLLENRRKVVMEPRERKVQVLLQHLPLIRNEKMKKRKLKEENKKKELEAQKAKDEVLLKKRTREERRDRYREQ